jgi:RNA exonuclease 1
MAQKRAHSEIEDENPFKSLDLDNDGDSSKAVVEEKWDVVQHKKKKKSKNNSGGDHGSRLDPRQPSITFSPNVRLNGWVKMRDLQGLVLYLLADEPSPHWVAVSGRSDIDRIVILQIPGLDADLFSGKLLPLNSQNHQQENGDSDEPKDSKSELPVHGKDELSTHSPDDYYPNTLDPATLHNYLRPLTDIFTHRWPIRAAGEDKSQFLWSSSRSMLSSPIPKPKAQNKKKSGVGAVDAPHWVNKLTPVTHFVASREDLVNSEYILHPAMCVSDPDRQSVLERRMQNKTSPDDGWVDSPVQMLDIKKRDGFDQMDPTAGWSVIAIDCEMCKTSKIDFELTRISVISWDNAVILDELVKPPRPITDYLTQYSGITKDMLEPVSTTLEDIQKRLLDIITDRTIVVGHSLNADFNALKFTHPYIIDTSIIFPHPRGPPLRSSLKYLTQRYLNREIQTKHGSSGHDSIEDARAVLDLVKQKCEKGPEWGMAGMSDEPIYRRISRTQIKAKTTSPQRNESVLKMMTAHVNYTDYHNNYGVFADLNIHCTSDAEVADGIKTAVSVDRGASVTCGANFIWAELRKLEDVRGWRHNDLKFPGSRNDI